MDFIWDADSRSFFDTVSQERLVELLKHRIGDPRMHLIQKWLEVGVLEDGIATTSEMGTGQGSVISPLLANIYLHYVFDLWAEQWRRRDAKGDMIIVRYADDIVVGFEHEADARRFWDACAKRFEEFALSLHPDKTRLIEFGRFAVRARETRARQTGDLQLPGVHPHLRTLTSGQVPAQTEVPERSGAAKLRAVKVELRRRMHQPIPEQGKWLGQVVRGFFGYHAVPLNSWTLGAFRHYVTQLWMRTLRRRSQRDGCTWRTIGQIADHFIPRPKVLHPWPNLRFAAKHPRWEPYALIGPVRFCAGGGQQ